MNKRFKSLFTFVALLLVTLTLVACTSQAKKDANAVAEAKESLVVGFTAPDTAASVTQDVTLKAKEGEVDVTWVSNNTAVITNAGDVTRPEADTVVELTATLKKGEATDTKKFSLTVKAAEVVVDPDIAIVEGVKEALALGFATGDTAAAVTQNITLKTTEDGVAITWISNNTAVITNAGVVTRPAADTTVKLTATLSKGAVKETKVFDVTVLAAEVVETGAKAALIAHYADTFEDVEWLATEDVVLVDKITGSDDNDYDVTWEIITGTEFFALDGKITRPTFTEGDKTIQLRASIEDGSTYDFFFTIKSLDQTDEEKVIAALNQVTAGETFPSGYQELNFVTVPTVKIGDEDVTVTWESSDITVMTHTGELVAFEDAKFKEVTLTATITYKGITESKVVEFKVLGVKIFTNFNDALSTENFTVVSGDVIGAKVKVEGVALYKDIVDGFYLVSEGNRLGFVYGTRNADVVKEGKLYDVTFNVDVYYGTYQLKGASFSNERDGEIPTVTPLEVTLEDIVTLPKPSNTTPNHHTLYTLKDVAVRVDDPADNYKTFLIPVDLPAGTALTDQNSIMIYYKSDLDVIKSLDGKKISSIEVINNGYRTNNVVWNVNFIGELEDIQLILTDLEVVEAVKENWETKIPNLIYKDTDLAFTTNDLETTITWSSSHPEIISTSGVVEIPETPTEVTLNATIKFNDAELTLEKVVLVGTGTGITSDIEDVLSGNVGDTFQLTATVTGIASNRAYTFEDETGAIALYVNSSSVLLEIGFEYTVIGKKALFNGLIQLAQVEPVVKGEAKALPVAIDITEEMLAHDDGIGHLQGRLVNIDNAIVSKVTVDSYKNIELELTVGTEKITLKWDSRMTLTEEAETHLASIAKDDVVNIVAAPLGWYNGPLLGYNVETQVVLTALTDARKVELDKAELKLATTYTQEFELPTEGSRGSVITWVADPASSLADGKLVIPTEGEVEVTLTATLKVNDIEDTKKFTVTLKALLGEEELALTIDFGDAQKTGYGAGVLKFTNTFDGKEYGLNKDRVQINNSNYAPHNGDYILVMSVNTTAKTSWIEFDFSEFDGLSKIEVAFSVWNNTQFNSVVGSSVAKISLEVLNDGEWVAVENDNGLTNVISELVVNQYTTITFDNLVAGKYRLVYDDQNTTASGNTTTAITVKEVNLFEIK